MHGKAVLITGGTMGIGLATGLAFARHGAHCTLTYRWGTADESEVFEKFSAAGGLRPELVQADVSSEEDTTLVLEGIRERHGHLDVFVSNVAVAQIIRSFDAYQKRALFKSIDYSVWPMFAYLQHARAIFGGYPRYVVGVSSGGPDQYVSGYDFVAGCKALLETLARYTAYRLAEVNVNIVRPGFVRTESLRNTFGEEFETFAAKLGRSEQFIAPEGVGDVIVALCSGLLDGVNGQVLTIDRGGTFSETLARLDPNAALFQKPTHP